MTPSTPLKRLPRGTWIRRLILPALLGAATLALIFGTERQEVEFAIGVTFNHLAGSLLLVDAPRQSVRLLVSGTPSTLATIDPKTISCRLDLSGLGEGTHTVQVNATDIGLPRGVALRALLTPSLTIRLATVSTKPVGVIAVLEGNPAPGFAVAAVTLIPDRIVLKGTIAMLAGFDTVKTRPITIEGASEAFKKEVPLNLPEAIAVEPPLRIVVAEVQVKERIITRVLENMPVSGKGTDAAHQIHPDAITLTVSGPEAIVNTIETDPAFGVIVNLTGMAPGTHSLKAVINLPVRTTLLHVSPERFSVTISQ